MSDLDAMHYGRTGKNHQGSKKTADESEERETPAVGDADMWDQLA